MARKPRLHNPEFPTTSSCVGMLVMTFSLVKKIATDSIFFCRKVWKDSGIASMRSGLVSLAPEVARDPTSLSFAARRVAERAREDDALHQKIEMLRHAFASLQA